MINRLKLRLFNIQLLIITIFLMLIGVLAVNSANNSFTRKNIFGFILGIFVIFLFSRIDYRKYLNYDWLLYIINLVLLIMVKLPIIGHTSNSARRWIKLFGIQIQPSELSKILLILFVAAFVHKHHEHLNTIRYLFIIAIMLAIPLALVVTQPDLSTTLLTSIVLFTILFIGGLSIKLIIFGLISIVPTFIIFLWYVQQPWQKLLRPFQQRRVLSFLYPSKFSSTESYQQLNSILAIGSGKLLGNGLNNHLPSAVKNGNYIPFPQTDFIFAIIGEDLGFVGTALTIILLFSMVIILYVFSMRVTDMFARLILVGIASYIGFQTFINIGVVTMILPNTGLPLPFISYGLTSLMTSCIMIGIVMNISRSKIEMYS